MLEAGVLNTLLIRMDLPYATQLRCTRPPDVELGGEEYPWDTMLLITSLLWRLMGAVLPAGKPLPDCLLKDLPALQQCAMWGLRYSFQRQVLRGRHRAVNARIRNDIAALILAGVVALPSSWDLVGSGIAELIVGLLGAIESGSTRIWAEDVTFSDSDDDLFFKRILLTIVAHLAHLDICVFVIRSCRFSVKSQLFAVR
ncbi:uncharacterized protein LOC105180761 [Harpegnathos saltator]|uniref:uncharacterized protein LOC105180761 n=1 Tax=Harpegnathos saltator TaxID=610380 RepID=UPI000DBEE276|nr:uncharacterized protein LOC105180761 [Harpegnathos saltator]